MERRKFMKGALSFTALIAVHRLAQSCNPVLGGTINADDDRSCRFPEITLYTSKIEEMYEFYTEVLDIPAFDNDETQFSLQIGETLLRFKEGEDGTEPLYHYAFNIPSNKHEQAKKWLEERVELLGGGTYYFDFWDAHAIYFKDPSGNIGEFIARHTMDNDRSGEFGISDLLCVSEIGTPVEDPNDLAEELKKAYGLDTYGEDMFVGDEYGLFVVPPVDRFWFPDFTVKASIHPMEITIADEGQGQFQYLDYPYSVERKK